ncbi:hypothetical protein [Devosia nitrariae]|uniref:Phage holin family protein n=1 Tax=Devosia nitrariae TaxID=2071872 RepID=A0ABQ5VZ51_9HYPH|nr:hypothetical protein [Devosia nitrariae]GLQ53053.1 hypothetical protein GCM10010862_03110 [Devosia nitrariae]
MANIEFDDIRNAVLAAKREARALGHVHATQILLTAAGFAAATIIAVAAVFLGQLV